MRRGIVVALVVLGLAAPADAAVTRLRVDWSGASQRSPAVGVYTDGTFAGEHRVAAYAQGTRWGESDLNAFGYPRVITFVDELPERARRMCFSLRHPYPPGVVLPMPVSVTLTDPGGASRTVQLTLDNGESAPPQCTPADVVLPAPLTGAPDYDPTEPPWWAEALKVLRARGATCVTATPDMPAKDPTTGLPAGSYREDHKECTAVAWVRTNQPGDRCNHRLAHGNPSGNDYSWTCRIHASPGTRARPNHASWYCLREKSAQYLLDFIDTQSEELWETKPTNVFPARDSTTLAGCLAPRARVEKLARGLAVTCSAACRVAVRGGATRRLPAGGRRALLRGPRSHVSVSAGRYRASATLRKPLTILNLR